MSLLDEIKKREVWKGKFVNRLIEKYGFSKEFAEETYYASIEYFDYDEDPVDCADKEMECRGD